jgi:hypothetical protein
MIKTHIISFNNKDFVNKKIFIHSDDTKINSKEIKEKCHLIYSLLDDEIFKNKDIVSVHWKDLQSRNITKEVKDVELAMIVTEVAINAIQKLPRTAFVVQIETLMEAWPAEIPIINFVWHLLLLPLLWIGRFIGQNRDKVIHQLEDLDRSFNYNSSQDYVKEYQDHIQFLLTSLEDRDSSKVKGLKLHLENMKSDSELLQKAIKNSTLSESSISLAKLLKDRSENGEKNKEQVLLTLPIGFYEEGIYNPLLATFRVDEKGEFYLDLSYPGKLKVESALKESYCFETLPEQEQLTELLHSLSTLTVKAPSDSIAVQPNYREKIRIKVLRQFDNGKPTTPNGDSPIELKFKPEEWLHEKICLLKGTPLVTNKEKPLDQTLQTIIGTDLSRFFEEVPLPNKIVVLINLIETYYDRYMQAAPYLSESQRSRHLQLLTFKVKKLEAHLVKRMGEEGFKELKTTHNAFESFFKKVAQIESTKKSIEDNRRSNKASEIDSSVKKSAGSYQFSPDIKVTSLTESTQIGETLEVASIYKNELDAVIDAVQKDDLVSLANALKTIQKKSETLIINKSYASAKELSLLALSYLPVPQHDSNKNFDDLYRISTNEKRELLLQIYQLNKHIWESSLRLKESFTDPFQLIQMMKSQVIASLFGGNNFLDCQEMLDLILKHPHYRFGWLPKQQKEVIQILNFVKVERLNSTGDWDRGEDSKIGYKEKFPDQHFSSFKEQVKIRLQCMMTCLIKPDSTLYPFFARDLVNAVQGVTGLDALVKEAVERGAKNRQEKSELIKVIKFEQVQKRLSSMKRLDILTKDQFVTDKYCFTIGDPSSKCETIAYFSKDPWTQITKEYEKKYFFSNTQANTKPLVGSVRGEEVYLTPEDEVSVFTETQMFLGHSGTLTEQKGMTEPSLLKNNQQRDPKSSISQTSNYMIESSQVTHQNNKISFQTVYETLNLIRTQPHFLAHREFQRTIFLNMTHPQFMVDAISHNALYFEELAKDLHQLIDKNSASSEVVSFLLMIGDTLAKHADQAQLEDKGLSLDSLIQSLPTFESDITFGDKTKTGRQWLSGWLSDPEKESSSLSLTYIYANYDRSLDNDSTEELALLMHAAKIFMDTGDSIGLPIFNRELKKWIQRSLIPHVQKKMQNEESRVELLNDWMRLALNDITYSKSDWKCSESNCENSDFKINLKTISLESKNSLYPLNGLQIPLPTAIARSLSSLIGLDSKIKATLKRGKTVSENIYEFEHNKHLYAVYHNQESGEISLYQKLPLDMRNPTKKMEWFEYRKQKAPEGKKLSAVENLMVKKGLWVCSTHPNHCYLYTALPSENKNETPYWVELNKEGIIQKVTDPVTEMVVLLDSDNRMSDSIPCVDSSEVIFLKKPTRFNRGYQGATEVRFIQNGASLVRQRRGDWIYHNESLGEGYRRLTDFSDEKLLLKWRGGTKGFLDSLEGLDEQFILPVSNGKAHTFLIHPYPIQSCKSGLKISFEQSKSILPSTAPLMAIHFDDSGKIEGNPSAFLYLAYVYSRMKKYDLANHYLTLAKKAAVSSPSESRALEALELLFEEKHTPSLRDTAFQLRAQLTLQSIKTEQLSETIFNLEDSGRFLDNLQHIAHLYKEYQKRSHELQNGALNQKELFELEKYLNMSMDCYVEHRKKNSPFEENSLDVNFKEFTQVKTESQLDESIDLLPLLLLSNLKAPLKLEELLKPQFPDANHIVRHFFQIVAAIALAIRNEDKGTLQKMELFLNSPKMWELSSSKSKEDNESVEMAKWCGSYLDLLIKQGKESFGDIISATDRRDVTIIRMEDLLQNIYQLQQKLPYYDRSLGFISTFLDMRMQTIKVVESVKSQLATLLKDFIKTDVQPLVNSTGTFDKRTIGKHITTLTDVIEVIEKDSPSFLTPIEKSEIPRLIKEAEKPDMQEPHELLSLLRKSEASGLSFLEIRHEAETSRFIKELEKEIGERKLPDTSHREWKDNEQISIDFKSIRDKFPSLMVSEDDNSLKEKLKAIKEKKEQIQSYFKEDLKERPLHKDEFEQLLKGLEIAEETLKEEICRKTHFSKSELNNLQSTVKNEVEEGRKKEMKQRDQILEKIRSIKEIPLTIKEKMDRPDIYTEYELLQSIFDAYADPVSSVPLEELESLITEYLLHHAAWLQLKQANELLDNNPTEELAAKTLYMIYSGLNEKRFEQQELKDLFPIRLCLVLEAREGLIYRPAQLRAIHKFYQDPNQWDSIRMGIGKTSQILPALAKMLSQKGKFVIITVPENALKGNRKSMDRTTRYLLNQAGWELNLPLTERIPHNYLAEQYQHLLKIVKDYGYAITSVEQLCSLDNMIIQLEEQKSKLMEQLNKESVLEIIFIEKRLHYLRKIGALIHGEATDLNVEVQFLEDEADTNSVSNFVNLGMGEKAPPNEIVRQVTRIIFNIILEVKKNSPLHKLKAMLLNESEPVFTSDELDKFMQECAKELQSNQEFSNAIGDDLTQIIKKVDTTEWMNYITGKSPKLPKGMNGWDSKDKNLPYIASAKQILSPILKGMLNIKSGNAYGFSDFKGFLVVPKTTGNEIEGMTFSCVFEFIAAQYLGYLAINSSKGQTSLSENSFEANLKTYKNKYPSKYEKITEDYLKYRKGKLENEALPLNEWLKTAEAWRYRFEIFEEIVFNEGYIRLFEEQITRGVQEPFHQVKLDNKTQKGVGGVTGTLDAYILPYISDKVQFNQSEDKKSSTRTVEAETLLRCAKNLSNGIDTAVGIYEESEAMDYVKKHILSSKTTTAFINNSGVTSEGKDTISWISSLRNTEEGKSRTYRFNHPEHRIIYLWEPSADEPVPFKTQQIPSDCIDVYGVGDTRGVHITIHQGDVHVCIGASATTEEVAQTLYRAREIGDKHRIILHISKSWSEQIVPINKERGITYGDVFKAIINRTSDSKASINEAAQLEKILKQLKTVVSKHLRRTHKEYDEIDFWCEKNAITLLGFIQNENAIFKAVRDLYIIKKEIDFQSIYQPVEKITGIEKMNDAFASLKESTSDLLKNLEKSGVETELMQDLEDLLKEIPYQKESFEKNVDLHKKYLPQETTKITAGSQGTKEQVKEMQQERTKTKEVSEDDPESAEKFIKSPIRSYEKLDVNLLFCAVNNKKLKSPFEELMISDEAKEVMKTLDRNKGDPLLYLVAARSKSGGPTLFTLISKQDYTKVIFEKIEDVRSNGSTLHVYSINQEGFSLINSTDKDSQLDWKTNPQFIAAKCYLGMKEYSKEEGVLVKEWVKKLDSSKLDDLKRFAKDKGTSALYDLFFNN